MWGKTAPLPVDTWHLVRCVQQSCVMSSAGWFGLRVHGAVWHLADPCQGPALMQCPWQPHSEHAAGCSRETTMNPAAQRTLQTPPDT